MPVEDAEVKGEYNLLLENESLMGFVSATCLQRVAFMSSLISSIIFSTRHLCWKREHLIQFKGQNLNTTELIIEASGKII